MFCIRIVVKCSLRKDVYKRQFISFVTHGLKAAIIIALLAIIALGVYFRKFKAAAKDKRLDLRALVLICLLYTSRCV